MSEPRIDAEFQAIIPPLAGDELELLKENLLTDGCRDPLVVWAGHDVLIDGHHRLAICQRHGVPYTTAEVHLPDRAAVKVWIAKNQRGRRNLSAFMKAELGMVIEKNLPSKQGARRDLTSSRIHDEVERPSRLAPKAVGVSQQTYDRAKVIAAKAPEAVKEKLRAGETTINKEYKAIVARERHAEQVAAVESYSGPSDKYHVIVADPPWAYESRAADPTHRAANPYPSMSAEAIAAMSVGDYSKDDAILWLWTTNAFMVQAHEVAEAWGFSVKTILTWAKDRMGTGDWLRGQTEHCLMAVRGRPVVTLTNQTTLLSGPLREHSRKPDEFYALVETLCPGSKLELFSRSQRLGWSCCGAEVGAFGGHGD